MSDDRDLVLPPRGNHESWEEIRKRMPVTDRERALLSFLREPETRDVLKHVANGWTADASFYGDRIHTLLSLLDSLDAGGAA